MAVDKGLFTRLRRLFSTNVVVRQVGGKKLKVADTSRTQSSIKHQLIDRYQKIHLLSSMDMMVVLLFNNNV